MTCLRLLRYVFGSRVYRTKGMFIKLPLNCLGGFQVTQKDVAKITRWQLSLWHQPDLGFNAQFCHLQL